MKMQLKRMLSGVLTLALLLGFCAGGFAPKVSVTRAHLKASMSHRGKALLFPAERTLPPTATTVLLPSRQV